MDNAKLASSAILNARWTSDGSSGNSSTYDRVEQRSRVHALTGGTCGRQVLLGTCRKVRRCRSITGDTMMFQLSSPAFAAGSTIPRKYSGDGENLSPPLQWSGAPRETRSFALVCEDPDAPSGTFRHWAVANIAADRTGLSEGAGAQPSSYAFARNDFGHAAYDG